MKKKFILVKQHFLIKKTIKLKILQEETSKTEKCKNRKMKKQQLYIFGHKPYVKNDIFENKLF